MRSVAGLTQQQLADLLRCSRMSIQQIESGKLRMSHKMAEKISLHTGVSMNWLLANQYRVPPVWQRDSEQPYTREAFKLTRAEVSRPRINPLDVGFLENVLAVAYHRLNAVAEEAYRTDKTVYFHYQLREFLEELERQWPASTNLHPSMKVAQTAALFHERLEKVRRAKKHSKHQK